MIELLERERELAAIDELLDRRAAVLLVEGGAGIGKTSLVEAACLRAAAKEMGVLRARGSELEADFAFGVVRQLFERRLATADAEERELLLAGPARAVRPLLLGVLAGASAFDTSFAVLRGLYWLAANLADRRPLLIAVDDAHWADEPSLRWLAHMARRIEGLDVALLVALRPVDATSTGASLAAMRAEASGVARPALLSEAAVGVLVRGAVGEAASDALRAAVWQASGGNPFYLTELLRVVDIDEASPGEVDPAELLLGGHEGIARRVLARVRGLDPRALGLAQALAVLGDGCELRHAAAIVGLEMADAMPLAAALVRVEVLASDDRPRFVHPVVRDAVEGSLGSDARDAAHRAAARILHADAAPAGQVASHLVGVRPAGDAWVLARLREGAWAAMESGAPRGAAALLERALAEPPPPAARVAVLREASRAEAAAGRERACVHLEEALALATDPRERAFLALEVAEAYASLFRWVDAVDVIERALAELGHLDEALAARLEGELVVCGYHDARRASRVAPALERLSSRALEGSAAEALAVARGMGMVLAGRPAEDASRPLERALEGASPWAENWDTRAALLWSLVTAERFEAVNAALGPMLAEVDRSGSARGLVAVYSSASARRRKVQGGDPLAKPPSRRRGFRRSHPTPAVNLSPLRITPPMTNRPAATADVRG